MTHPEVPGASRESTTLGTVVVAVVLAAGGGTRFAGPGPKLLAPFRGRPLVAWALDAAVASGLPVLVVTGAADLGDVVPAGVTAVVNPNWAEGQASSVAVAVGAARASGHGAVVVGLGDQPFVEADAWRAVAGADAPIAVATYDGVRGHPVRLGAETWPLLPVTGDAVGRAVMALRPDWVREIPCTGRATDIDTAEELSRWS